MVELRWLPACLAFGLLAAPAVTAPAPKKPKGHATPLAAFKAVQAALKKKDWKEAYKHRTPEAQEVQTGQAVLLAALYVNRQMANSDNKAKEKLEAVATKFGVSDKTLAKVQRDHGNLNWSNTDATYKVLKPLAKLVKDRPGFVEAVFKVVMTADSPMATAELKGLAITGTSAEATMIFAQQKQTYRATFAKTGGGWRMGLFYIQNQGVTP